MLWYRKERSFSLRAPVRKSPEEGETFDQGLAGCGQAKGGDWADFMEALKYLNLYITFIQGTVMGDMCFIYSRDVDILEILACLKLFRQWKGNSVPSFFYSEK